MLRRLPLFTKELLAITRKEGLHWHHIALWKYFFIWRKLMNAQSMDQRLPWISFPAIDVLDNYLKSGMRVFEYGGGGSSLFFSDRNCDVVTVEHHKEWFQLLEQKLQSNKHWKGIFVAPVKMETTSEDYANPDAYVSSDTDYQGYSFQPYAQAIDDQGMFDVVLVDGRSRPSCLKHGMRNVKPGGLLILDNSDRDYYTSQTQTLIDEQFDVVLNYSGPTAFCSWFNRTTIWKKRAS